MGLLSSRKPGPGGPASAGALGLLQFAQGLGEMGLGPRGGGEAGGAETGATPDPKILQFALNPRQPANSPPTGGNALGAACRAPAVSDRDNDFLGKYFGPVAALSKQYGVDPALVLGVAGESGFGVTGTYRKTGDAFGMTGGSTRHMARASSPEQNVGQFFRNFGRQIQGSGSDVGRFINGLQGRDPSGATVPGWKRYNSARPGYDGRLNGWIDGMQNVVPKYVQACPP